MKAAPGNAQLSILEFEAPHVGPLRSTLTPARSPAVWTWCRPGSDRATAGSRLSRPRLPGRGSQKGFESASKQAGRLVTEHGSGEAQKAAPSAALTFDHCPQSQGGTHRSSAASESPDAFLSMAACGVQPLPRFIPAREQWPIVVLSPLPEYALLASGRHVVEDRAQPRPYRGATSERAPAKQK